MNPKGPHVLGPCVAATSGFQINVGASLKSGRLFSAKASSQVLLVANEMAIAWQKNAISVVGGGQRPAREEPSLAIYPYLHWQVSLVAARSLKTAAIA